MSYDTIIQLGVSFCDFVNKWSEKENKLKVPLFCLYVKSLLFDLCQYPNALYYGMVLVLTVWFSGVLRSVHCLSVDRLSEKYCEYIIC